MYANLVRILVMVIMIGGLSSRGALAQSHEFGQTQLLHVCSASSKACKNAVDVVIRQLKALDSTPAVFNTQLGIVAGAIVEASKGSNGSDYNGLGAAMVQVANASSNTAQASAIRRGVNSEFWRNPSRGRGNPRGHGRGLGSSPN